MTDITVRNLGDELENELCSQAEDHGHSVEEEVCEILSRSVAKESDSSFRRKLLELVEPTDHVAEPSGSLTAGEFLEVVREAVKPLRGLDLPPLPEREKAPLREPPDFITRE